MTKYREITCRRYWYTDILKKTISKAPINIDTISIFWTYRPTLSNRGVDHVLRFVSAYKTLKAASASLPVKPM